MLGEDRAARIRERIERIGERKPGDGHQVIGAVDRRTHGIGRENGKDAARSASGFCRRIDRHLVSARTDDRDGTADLNLIGQRDRAGQA